ncbi:MAG TPA: hypothetical protein VMU57_06860 [Edaphobacter sp.]|uniref:hypothetical protein n=1 Tax=Edaphobacter sp. TaxID=1934404 RepID=UPI002D085614|nr:hypothetical protein [Edaphobacter sp.]HUZ94618.1 hypothetical protein [Edaphobacter sp.]
MPTFSQIARVIAMGLGVAGFCLSVFNFRRDRAKLQVTLQRAGDRQGNLSPSFPALYIEIANIGRRSAFVKQAGQRARDKRAFRWHELDNRVINRSLGEGDASISESFMLKDLGRFREKNALQAFAIDSKGKRIFSNTLQNKDFPGPKLSRRG